MYILREGVTCSLSPLRTTDHLVNIDYSMTLSCYVCSLICSVDLLTANMYWTFQLQIIGLWTGKSIVRMRD